MKKLIGKTLIALAIAGAVPALHAQEPVAVAAVISEQELDTAAANIAAAAKPDVSDRALKSKH